MIFPSFHGSDVRKGFLDPLSTLLIGSSFFLVLVAAIIGFFRLFKKIYFQENNKEIKSSSLSLASPSASISPNWIHHVFPSFHGPDVRKGFLSHILKSFKSNGIEPFIDNDIERSKSIGPELKEAIRGSRIAIVLLSKNYASSSWCLDELVEIMRCREVLGQIVITIFYDVPPTDIRKQIGAFGEAFKKTCKDKPKEHIERWRKALEDVAGIAGIAGMDSGVWVNEAIMIEEITSKVSDKLRNFTPPRDFKDLVGMSSHMEEIKPLLCLELNEGRMIGIWGPPGIGKTTIARFLFHQLSCRFQLRAIIVNIKFSYPRPCLDEYNARLQLQHQMLLEISNQKEVPNIELALNGLKDKKVLLVLDDVDRIEQVHALAKEIGWFGPGSCIIITTENRRILEAQGIEHIYQVKSPSSEEAFKIFCMNAFGKEYPDDGFYELACEATDLAGELPLGLKVLGSALRGMSKQEWRRALPMLKARFVDRDIESIIKFSYDALHDEEKDLFLYIAFLFSGYYITAHAAEELLAKKFWNVKQGVDILVKKSFLYIEGGAFKVHTLLKQFGREMLRKQVERQLLINAKDLCDHRIDCSKVIGIDLNFSEGLNELNISEKAVERMSDVQFIRIIDDDYGCAPCERLHSLFYHSQMIRYLFWISFQNKSLPVTFNPESLVRLDMSYSKLQKLWEGNRPLNCLKWMHLAFSIYLKELPDLSTATNLEYLNIYGCSSLKELPDLSTATNLEYLDTSGCSSLKELPDLSTATNLEYLDISRCSNLRKLRKFHLSNNLVSPQLSDSLTYIDASECESLETLEFSFDNPDICLKFINCFELNQKSRDLIMHTPTSKYAVLPGKHVPTCFKYRATDGDSLTIKLNETSFPTSLRFQACIILERPKYSYPAVPGYEACINIMVRNKEETRDYLFGYEDINITVKNKRRDIPYPRTEHIYTFEVEVSEVTSTELVFEFETDDSIWKVGECGLLQILEVPVMGKRREKRTRNTKEGGKKKRKMRHREREE